MKKRDSEERKRLFFHIHIPKCGGTTFKEILQANFGSAYRRDEPLIFHQFGAEYVKNIVRAHASWLRCYSTHMLSLDLPFHLQDIPLHAITFVRNPVDRFISQYYWLRNHHRYDHTPEAKELDLEGFIEYGLGQGHLHSYINGQIRYLTGGEDKSDLARVKRLVNDGQVLLMPLDMFDESCVMLETLFPDNFTDCTYPKAQNTKKASQGATIAQKQRIEAYMADSHDFELVETAQVLLDKLIEKNFSDREQFETALAEFQTKCAVKKVEFEKQKKKKKAQANKITILQNRCKTLESQYNTLTRQNENLENKIKNLTDQRQSLKNDLLILQKDPILRPIIQIRSSLGLGFKHLMPQKIYNYLRATYRKFR